MLYLWMMTGPGGMHTVHGYKGGCVGRRWAFMPGKQANLWPWADHLRSPLSSSSLAECELEPLPHRAAVKFKWKHFQTASIVQQRPPQKEMGSHYQVSEQRLWLLLGKLLEDGPEGVRLEDP